MKEANQGSEGSDEAKRVRRNEERWQGGKGRENGDMERRKQGKKIRTGGDGKTQGGKEKWADLG